MSSVNSNGNLYQSALSRKVVERGKRDAIVHRSGQPELEAVVARFDAVLAAIEAYEGECQRVVAAHDCSALEAEEARASLVVKEAFTRLTGTPAKSIAGLRAKLDIALRSEDIREDCWSGRMVHSVHRDLVALSGETPPGRSAS